VNLFAKPGKDRRWLERLLTIRNVTGSSRIRLRDDGLTLEGARIVGEDFLVLANARFRDERVEGGLYARYGVLGGAVEVIGEERAWHLLNAREWFDGYAKEFSGATPR
jgi:hypothetical protein